MMSPSGRAKTRVLVTGFGPFPGVEVNASGALIERLAGLALANVEVSAALLPVAWGEAVRLARKATLAARPHAILHFGVSRAALGFKLEVLARNEAVASPDIHGRAPGEGPLYPGKPQTLRATLPVADFAETLGKNGYSAAPSFDAGRYLCNAVFYASLLKGREKGGARVAFVHIPPVGTGRGDASSLTLADLVHGGKILVQECVRHGR